MSHGFMVREKLRPDYEGIETSPDVERLDRPEGRERN